MGTLQTTKKRETVSEQQAYAIAKEAYLYFYPLVTMETTRKQMTNLEAGKKPGFGPANTFSHLRAYPPADLRIIVRPNFDTLYSCAWIDLTQEPMIISAPDTAGRYYLLPMMDMWTDVFASPGWRTSGTQAQNYALLPKNWTGNLPDNVESIEAPTLYFWIIGRTKTDGPEDYNSVHAVQDGFKVTPLSQWGKTAVPQAQAKIDPSVDMVTPTIDTVNKMSAETYFSLAAELMKLHQPHITDWSLMARMARIGIKPGQFNFNSLDAGLQEQLNLAAKEALAEMLAKTKSMGRPVNGWQLNTDTMGVYGNFYLKRAVVAMVGLGANQPEDAVYPLNYADADGHPLQGENKYVLHFDSDKLPPVDAFWSITMYDEEGFQCGNSLNRFAVSSWMPLKKNADGSLDIYLQHANPGADKEANWLPSPESGKLGVTMRLYAPQEKVLNGDWVPPVIQKLGLHDQK